MTKQEAFLAKLFDEGLTDARNMAVVANAKALPDGGFGLCLLCLKDHILCVYDTDFRQNVGPKICQFDLRGIADFKASSFVFNRYMKFTCDGFTYKFADFGNAKDFIAAVSSEMRK